MAIVDGMGGFRFADNLNDRLLHLPRSRKVNTLGSLLNHAHRPYYHPNMGNHFMAFDSFDIRGRGRMTFITVTKISTRACNVCTRYRTHGYIKEFRHWYCIRTHFTDPEVAEEFHVQMDRLDGITLH